MEVETLGPGELAQLAIFLRDQGFTAGVAQVAAAQRLQCRMAANGVFPTAAEMAPWLAPVFATDSRNFVRFSELYKQWQSGSTETVKKVPEQTASKKKWLLVLPLLALIAGVVWWKMKSPSEQPSQPQNPTPSNRTAPQQQRKPAPVDNGYATITGTLKGFDGKPVAGARFLFEGNSDSQSDANGQFKISGQSGQPVLAMHCDYDAVLFPLVSKQNVPLTMVHKAQPGCNVSPPPPTGLSQPLRATIPRNLRVALSLIPIVALLAWIVYVIRRRIGLQKWQGAAGSNFAKIPLGDSSKILFSESELQRSVQELRRPQPVPLVELWPEPTVASTVENAGWFTPIYRARRQTQEYLILIDRNGKRDHQSRYGTDLVERLKVRGVFAHVFYFQTDPRICSEQGSESKVTLTDLSARYGSCQIWVMTEGVSFFNALTGRMQLWVDTFLQWPKRILLTPAASGDWGPREVQLADFGFEIIPATPRGLARIVEHVSRPGIALDAYPPMLEETPGRWVSNQAPNEREITRLRTELRLYLGRDGNRWLTACACYLVLDWPLTLYLGRAVVPADQFNPLLHKLIRLPWFRRGAMPVWLRTHLLNQDRNFREQVMGLLRDRLNSLPESGVNADKSPLEIALERDHTQRVGEDEVWLSLVWGRNPGSLLLPNTPLRRLLFSQRGAWIWLRPILMLAAAAVISAGIWFLTNPPRPVTPENELAQAARVVVDVASSQYHDSAYYLARGDMNEYFADWCYQVTQLLLNRPITLQNATDQSSDPVPGAVFRQDGISGIKMNYGWYLVDVHQEITATDQRPSSNLWEIPSLGAGPLNSIDLPALPATQQSVGNNVANRMPVTKASQPAPDNVATRNWTTVAPTRAWCYQESGSERSKAWQLQPGLFGAYCHSSRQDCEKASSGAVAASSCAYIDPLNTAAWGGSNPLPKGLFGSWYRINMTAPLGPPFPQLTATGSTGHYGIVVSADREWDSANPQGVDAMFEVDKLATLGFPNNVAEFYKDGYYRTVLRIAPDESGGAAAKMLDGLRNSRWKDAYLVDLDKWCPTPQAMTPLTYNDRQIEQVACGNPPAGAGTSAQPTTSTARPAANQASPVRPQVANQVSAWFAQLQQGSFQYEVPKVMVWKSSSTVTVRINGPRAAASTVTPGAAVSGAIRVSDRMKVVLSSPENPDEFIITMTGGTSDTQFVPVDGATTWKWSVMPKYTRSSQKLAISVWVVTPGSGDNILRELPVYSATVDVHAPASAKYSRSCLKAIATTGCATAFQASPVLFLLSECSSLCANRPLFPPFSLWL